MPKAKKTKKQQTKPRKPIVAKAVKAATKKAAAKKVAAKKAIKPKAATKPAAPAAMEETVDRKILKAITTQLKDMGVDIKVLKSDSDEALQKKVNEALQKLPSADLVKKLESIDPVKLVSFLKRDCIGVFIDLSDVSCIRCVDVQKCATQFIGNLKGKFSGDLTKVMGEAKTEKPKPVKLVVAPVSRYKPERAVFVRDQPNPNPEGDPYHDTWNAILKEEPTTLKELRDIVERDFEIDNDGDFMKFVTTLRDPAEGIIKLDVDLSEKDKKALREAGYKV